MTYQLYRKVLERKVFFDSWKSGDPWKLTEDEREGHYQKYLLKCTVFARDKFKCQNKDCGSITGITLHHTRKRANGGKDTPRNTVTVCLPCHNKFNAIKIPLVYNKINYDSNRVYDKLNDLPPHIQGHTFWYHKEEVINWKQIKAENRKFRKKLMLEQPNINKGHELSYLIILLRVFEINFITGAKALQSR